MGYIFCPLLLFIAACNKIKNNKFSIMFFKGIISCPWLFHLPLQMVDVHAFSCSVDQNTECFFGY